MPTVSTNDLADYPVGAVVLLDEERWELYKRVQTADGTRVVLVAAAGPYAEREIEVARADQDEPMWQVAPLYLEDPPVYRPTEEGR